MIPLAVAISAWESVTANRLRASLAMVSVVLGVLALTLVASLGTASETAIREAIARTLGRPATLEAELVGDDGTGWRHDGLQAHLRQAREDGLFAAVTPHRRLGTQVVGASGQVLQAQVEVVAPSLADMRALDVTAGRWLRDHDEASYAPVVVANAVLLDELGTEAGPLVRAAASLHVSLGHVVAARVVGVVEDGAREPMLYAHHGTVERWIDTSVSARSLLFRVPPDQVASSARLLEHALEAALPEQDVRISRRDNADSMASVVTTVSALLGAMGVVALVIGSIGTLNLGLVTVRERSRELGLRRAFGARTKDVFWIVLAEAVLTNVVAGLVGVVLAIPLTRLAPVLVRLPVAGAEVSGGFPVGAAAVGLAAAVAAGVLGGWVPARRATRLDVIRAIRG